MTFDRTKTLQELGGQDWGEPTFHSYLVRNTYRLRRVPLQDFTVEDFTVEDLRLMINTWRGLTELSYFVPMALEALEENPAAEGVHYPSDLFAAFEKVPVEFWDAHPDLKARFDRVAAIAVPLLAQMEAELDAEYTAAGGYSGAPEDARSA